MSGKCLAAILVSALLLPLASDVMAESAGPEEILKQYISDLQRAPNDNALREKIVRHVKTMGPSPAIPEEARRHYVMAKTLFDAAKTSEDLSEAIAGFRSALLIAPWWAEANRDLGLALEAAQHYDEAITCIKLYIATGPGDERTRAAQDEIYKVEAKGKLAMRAARESGKSPAAEARQNPFEALLKKIDGRKYRNSKGGTAVVEVRGRFLVIIDPSQGQAIHLGPYEIRNRIAQTPRVMQPLPLPVQTTFTVGEDGDRIIERRDFSDGDMREFVWLWQR